MRRRLRQTLLNRSYMRGSETKLSFAPTFYIALIVLNVSNNLFTLFINKFKRSISCYVWKNQLYCDKLLLLRQAI